jgi:hypothetical protein
MAYDDMVSCSVWQLQSLERGVIVLDNWNATK